MEDQDLLERSTKKTKTTADGSNLVELMDSQGEKLDLLRGKAGEGRQSPNTSYKNVMMGREEGTYMDPYEEEQVSDDEEGDARDENDNMCPIIKLLKEEKKWLMNP